jgi:hypothetical protein
MEMDLLDFVLTTNEYGLRKGGRKPNPWGATAERA